MLKIEKNFVKSLVIETLYLYLRMIINETIKKNAMKTQKKIINAYIVTIYKRNGVVDNSYKSNDVSRVMYYENDNGTYDIHYYDGGNCVHKEYEVNRDNLLKRFEWKQSTIYSHVYTKYKMISKEIHYA